MSTPRTGYSLAQIGLHWAIALLIVINWFTSDGMGRALRSRIQSGASGLEGNTWHIWIGTLVFILILIRIAIRLAQGAPASEANGPDWMAQAALWGHRLLYVLMVLVPLTGAATWYFGLRALGDPHGVMSNLLLIVAGGHAAAALAHHFILKDDTLRRMWRPE